MKNKTLLLLIISQPLLRCETGENSKLQRHDHNPDTLAITSENEEEIITRPDLSAFNISYDTIANYNEQLKRVNEKRLQLKNSYESGNITSDDVSLQFCELLVNSIIPYWYGTQWSFEGHTDVPNHGEIACGYFVTTTLKHIGLNLNRFSMAREPAFNAMKSLTTTSSIVRLGGITSAQATSYMRKKTKEGIYIVGLDCHVGFLLHRKKEVFFIHSSYGSPYQVVVEYADSSRVLAASKGFYIAPLSNNSPLMNKWLNGTNIETVTK